MASAAPGTPAAAAGEALLLHGDLVLTVIEARRLPNMDLFSENLRRLFSTFHFPFPNCTSAGFQRRHHHHPKIITSDPYVTACLGDATIARTRVISNSEDPVWDEQFKIPLAHRAAALVFHVKDNDVFGSQPIGTVSIPTCLMISGVKIQDWFPIFGSNGKPPKPGAALHLAIEYTPVEKKTEYQHGIAGDPQMLGVRDAYFPLRRGGSLTLYQDAHGNDEELPEIRLEKGAIFKRENCWEDICHAILEAHHLIYVVGWSIYHKVKLVREPTRPLPSAGLLTLGELLKYKSQEGVRVCMLVWDDKTSHDKFFLKTVSPFNCLYIDHSLLRSNLIKRLIPIHLHAVNQTIFSSFAIFSLYLEES